MASYTSIYIYMNKSTYIIHTYIYIYMGWTGISEEREASSRHGVSGLLLASFGVREVTVVGLAKMTRRGGGGD